MTLYNLGNDSESLLAVNRLQKLMDKDAIVSIVEKRKQRTNNQNAYIYKMFQLFGVETGYFPEEAKIEIKRGIGFYYEKNGTKFLKSTSDLDTKDMGKFIDDMLKWCAEQGVALLTPEQYMESPGQVDEYIGRNSFGGEG